MIEVGKVWTADCSGISRRHVLQIGASGLLGLGLAELFRAEASGIKPPLDRRSRSCILIYLAGGPSQLETFDPKPDAQPEIRGPWGAIPTSVPGTQVSELVPSLAAMADQYALIRSLNHTNSVHTPLPMLTGNMQQTASYGAAFTWLTRNSLSTMPPYVHVGGRLPQVGTGSLSRGFGPVEVRNPNDRTSILAPFTLSADVSPERLADRALLSAELDGLKRRFDEAPSQSYSGYYERALEMLTTTRVRDAFDLEREPAPLRDRYGANLFGQSCLLARRLIEAGTRFVQVMWYDRDDGFTTGWDVHGYDAPGLVRMEQHLCPRFDQGLSALLRDLRERGLLDSTLVVVTGEFGRTPTCNRHGGRDHWPYCFSALLAGAGVPGGAVIGASDARAAYPTDQPVKPSDFAATLYHLLGVDVNSDDRLRSAVFEGAPIDGIC